MDAKYLENLDKLIKVGEDVLATRRIETKQSPALIGEDVVGKKYVQRKASSKTTDYVDIGMFTSWVTDTLFHLQNTYKGTARMYIENIEKTINAHATMYYANSIGADIIHKILLGLKEKVESGLIIPSQVDSHNISCTYNDGVDVLRGIGEMADTHVTKLKALVAEGENILRAKRHDMIQGEYIDGGKFTPWATSVLQYIKGSFQDATKAYADEIEKIIELTRKKSRFFPYHNANQIVGIAANVLRDFEAGNISLLSDIIPAESTIQSLYRIFDKFHDIARQMQARHSDRPTLTIEDEYDVQDLLHALLKLYFDDIRPEDAVSSFAGANSRTDFLLKKEKIVIEVKKTRRTMKAKALGEELIIDIARYKNHVDCKKLVCFIYDPEGMLGNPQGMMSDLNSQSEGFAEVIIRPL